MLTSVRLKFYYRCYSRQVYIRYTNMRRSSKYKNGMTFNTRMMILVELKNKMNNHCDTLIFSCLS